MQTLFLTTGKGNMAKFIQSVRHRKNWQELTKPQKANTSTSKQRFWGSDFQESWTDTNESIAS